MLGNEPTVEKLIELFKQERASTYKICLDPTTAQGECDYVSSVFAEYVEHATPHTPVDVMVCVGCISWPNHSWLPEPVRFEKYWHVLVRVDTTYIDWTVRQFDPNAKVPTIYTEAQLRAIWKSVRTYDEWANCRIA